MEERCHSELSYSMCPTTDPSLASNSSRKMSTLELPVWMGSTLLVVTPSNSMPDSSVLGCSAKSTWPWHNHSQLIRSDGLEVVLRIALRIDLRWKLSRLWA